MPLPRFQDRTDLPESQFITIYEIKKRFFLEFCKEIHLSEETGIDLLEEGFAFIKSNEKQIAKEVGLFQGKDKVFIFIKTGIIKLVVPTRNLVMFAGNFTDNDSFLEVYSQLITKNNPIVMPYFI